MIANFTIPSIVNRWTKLAIKVESEEISLYVNCELKEKTYWRRTVRNMEFEPGSALFIGQAGDLFLKDTPHFEVSRR